MRILPLVLGLAALLAAPRGAAQPGPGPQVVVALVDTGINPYHEAFRDPSPLAFQHPSTYLPGYPPDAPALRISLDAPSYEEAVRRDESLWATVAPRKLYWIPGTRIVGVIRFASGGTACPGPSQVPPAQLYAFCPERPILDEVGHGTMTASRAAAAQHSLAPQARIVMIEGLGQRGSLWAANAGWIDVQSNSWGTLVPWPLDEGVDAALAEAARRHLVLAASGNGLAFQGVAPEPTPLQPTAARGVILAGAHDNGRVAAWSGAPAHVVADGYGGWTARHDHLTAFEPDPVACCTSAAAPYAAGGAAAIVLEARRLMGDTRTGVRDGVVAQGAPPASSGPLADGVFTLEELRSVFLHTAEARPKEGRDDGLLHWSGEPRAPQLLPWGPGANPYCQGCWTAPVPWSDVPAEVPAYASIGYGAVNERSVELALRVLRGEVPLPPRPAEDAFFAASLR